MIAPIEIGDSSLNLSDLPRKKFGDLFGSSVRVEVFHQRDPQDDVTRDTLRKSERVDTCEKFIVD